MERPLERRRRLRSGETPRSGEAGRRPIRTCVACGRRAPKDELVRFVACDGILVAAEREGGRSAYTCRRLLCFERAASRNAFGRTLRRRVRVDQELARLYT